MSAVIKPHNCGLSAVVLSEILYEEGTAMLILHEIGAVREIHGVLGGIRARIPDEPKRRGPHKSPGMFEVEQSFRRLALVRYSIPGILELH